MDREPHLYHYGVRGMKWGVKKAKPKPVYARLRGRLINTSVSTTNNPSIKKNKTTKLNRKKTVTVGRNVYAALVPTGTKIKFADDKNNKKSTKKSTKKKTTNNKSVYARIIGTPIDPDFIKSLKK